MINAPVAPTHLSPDAVLEWNRLIADPDARAALGIGGEAELAIHCQAWARMAAAERHVNEHGVMVAAPRTGLPIVNPNLGIANQAAGIIRRSVGRPRKPAEIRFAAPAAETKDLASASVSPLALSGLVGLTTRRLGQLAAEGMPKDGRGEYPLAAAIQWLMAYWRTRAKGTPLNDARRRKVEADASRSEMELAKRRGELAPIAVLAQAHGEACTRIRTRLRAIPSKIAPEAQRAKTVAEVRVVLQREIDDALTELAEAARKALGRAP